jgi:ABC-type uncharacterized transport system ATPase subunit
VDQFASVVGQAWQSSSQDEVKNILTLVGLQHANPVIARLVAENRAQANEIAELHTQAE